MTNQVKPAKAVLVQANNIRKVPAHVRLTNK